MHKLFIFFLKKRFDCATVNLAQVEIEKKWDTGNFLDKELGGGE